MTAPKKTPRPKRKAPTKKKTTKKKVVEQKSGENIPAVVGGDSPTFTTLKRKEAMLNALKHSMGIVAPACEMVGIARSTHYDWLKADQGYRAEVEAIEESRYDFVETKMVERINAGSDTMLIWYSKTKMKHRGFIERTEVEVTNTPAFVVEESQKGAGKIMNLVHKKPPKEGTND